MSRTWDIGDPEPEDVDVVDDYTAPDFDPAWDVDESPRWVRTYKGDWKGYKNGKVYTDWGDLVRRWGPLTEES